MIDLGAWATETYRVKVQEDKLETPKINSNGRK